jgi:protein-S-isoprenylcysteine O-methyltransferase Ste14
MDLIASPSWVLLAVFIYGLVHSVLAALSTKAFVRKWMGPAVYRWYRLLFNVFATVTLLPVLVLPKLLPDKTMYQIPAPWVFVTLAIQLLALVLLVMGVFHTDAMKFIGLRQLFKGYQKDEPEPLVVNGLYKWVRHPLYTAGLLLIWFSPVMTINLFALYLGLTIYIVIGAIIEERKLRREFGSAYEKYQNLTPMLIPGLKRFQRN